MSQASSTKGPREAMPHEVSGWAEIFFIHQLIVGGFVLYVGVEQYGRVGGIGLALATVCSLESALTATNRLWPYRSELKRAVWSGRSMTRLYLSMFGAACGIMVFVGLLIAQGGPLVSEGSALTGLVVLMCYGAVLARWRQLSA